MKECKRPLGHRRVVTGANKAHGPGKRVTDLELPRRAESERGDENDLPISSHW